MLAVNYTMENYCRYQLTFYNKPVSLLPHQEIVQLVYSQNSHSLEHEDIQFYHHQK